MPLSGTVQTFLVSFSLRKSPQRQSQLAPQRPYFGWDSPRTLFKGVLLTTVEKKTKKKRGRGGGGWREAKGNRSRGKLLSILRAFRRSFHIDEDERRRWGKGEVWGKSKGESKTINTGVIVVLRPRATTPGVLWLMSCCWLIGREVLAQGWTRTCSPLQLTNTFRQINAGTVTPPKESRGVTVEPIVASGFRCKKFSKTGEHVYLNYGRFNTLRSNWRSETSAKWSIPFRLLRAPQFNYDKVDFPKTWSYKKKRVMKPGQALNEEKKLCRRLEPGELGYTDRH